MIRKTIFIFLLAAFFLAGSTEGKGPNEHELQQIREVAPSQPRVTPQQPRKLLVIDLSKGFKHSSIPYWNAALEIMGEKSGTYKAEISSDLNMLRAENLRRFDAVCLNNTTKLGINPEDNPEICKGLMDFIHGGGGLVGIHAATDNFYVWPEAQEMMGGKFTGHPWTSKGTWGIKLDEPDHPLLRAFRRENFTLNDEIYRTEPPLYDRSKQRVLMSLDFSHSATANAKGQKPTDKDTGIAWIKNVGKGRLFYCSLGHTHHVTWNPTILTFYLDGIQWAMGDLTGIDATPGGTGDGLEAGELRELSGILNTIRRYEYGLSRESLMSLIAFIRNAPHSPASREAMEGELLTFLKSYAAAAAKEFVLEQLSRFAGDSAVPVLEEMLSESRFANTARYALERIDGPAARKALREALADLQDTDSRIGVITSLGNMKDVAAIAQLEKLMYHRNEKVARAAVSALGNIADTRCVIVLEKAGGKLSEELKPDAQNALLQCADAMRKQGIEQEARAIYERLNEDDKPVMVRQAALRGQVLSMGEKGAAKVVEVLQADNAVDKTMIIGLINEIPGEQIVAQITRLWGELEPAYRTQLLAKLTERGDRQAMAVAFISILSNDRQEKLTAIEAMGSLGSPEVVIMLAELAATNDREISETARESLYRVSGDEVNRTIVSELEKVDNPVKVELIRALGQRQAMDTADVLLDYAGHDDKNVRRAALAVLVDMAGQKHLPALKALLNSLESSGDKKLLARAIREVVRRAGQNTSHIDGLLSDFHAMRDETTRMVIVEDVFGPLGDATALPDLRRLLVSGSEEMKTAVIRGLSEWPGDDAVPLLLETAEKTDDNNRRTLAVSGVVKLLGNDDRRPMEQTVGYFRRLMDAAKTIRMKKKVLGGLSQVAHYEALVLAEDAFNNAELELEAALAIVQVTEKIHQDYPLKIRTLLERILERVDNQTITDRARKVLDKLPPPNVALIIVDDLRPQLNCYGETQMITPNMDNLASEGVLFQRAYCQSPVCGPSRASMLTGLRPVPGRFVTYDASVDVDVPDVVTLAEHLKKNGYYTVSNGKVFHHKNDSLESWSERPWHPRGFWRNYLLDENNELNAQHGWGRPYECLEVEDDAYFDGQIAAKSIEDLERLKKIQPFLLATGFLKPHLPFNAPKKYWDMYPLDSIRLAENNYPPKNAPPEALHDWDELRSYYGMPGEGPMPDDLARKMLRGYYACTTYADAMVGRLLDALDASGLKNNTIVVLWGDHGWNLGEHTLWAKHCNFDTSLRAPLIVSVPGYCRNVTSDALVESIDIYPTLCELTRLAQPGHLQGKSLVPVLKDPEADHKTEIFCRYKVADSIRTDRFLYTEFFNKHNHPNNRMLYDHDNDPQENYNIADRPDLQELVDAFSQKLKTVRKD